MAWQELRCGCRVLNHGCVISPNCSADPKHSDSNPPGGGGRVGAVPPTPAAARKKHAASAKGQSGKAGRWVMPRDGGMVEPWKKDEETE